MSTDEADGRAATELRAMTMATGLVGGMAMVAVVLVSSDPWFATAAAVIAGAAFWGFFMWLALRRQTRRLWSRAPRTPHDTRGSERRAVRRGVLSALTLAAVLAVYVWGLHLIGWFDDGVPALIVGIALGLPVLNLLRLRDLRRWEAENDVRVCRRRGARRVAWTNAQAADRLVLLDGAR